MTNQEFIALVKKNPISLGCGVVALGCALALYFRNEQLPLAVSELEQVSARGLRLATNIRNSAKLDEQLAAIKEASGEIEPRLVRPGELANNLQFFYKLEAETGSKLLDLRQIEPGNRKSSAKGTYIPVEYAVSVQNDYAGLIEFLRRLEYGGVYCRVLSARLAHLGNELDRSAPLKLDLTLELLGRP